MQLKTILIFSVLIFSSLAGCVEDVREEQKIEKTDDLMKIEDRIVTNESATEISTIDVGLIDGDGAFFPILSENMTQKECEREGGVWIEAIEERSGNGTLNDMAMSTIRKIGGITDNNSIDDYDNDNSSSLDWNEFVEIWNSVEDVNLTNDSQTYRDLFASFHDLDFDSDGELSIAELLRSQDEITMNTRPSWCSFSTGDDFEVTQEMCEERGGTWIEASERERGSYCDFGEDDREESESNITQEDCERRGGTWTEAQNREGQYYCEYDDEEREESESNITQEDCERRGGTWTEASDREDEYYCDFEEDEREEESEV